MVGSATTKHENACSAGILPVFLRAFSKECAFIQANMAGTEARRHYIMVAAGVSAGHY